MTDRYTIHSPSTGQGSPDVHGIYDRPTGSWQYICADPATKACAFVDPVLDFDPAAARTSSETAEFLLSEMRRLGYRSAWILDTHPHADHFTAGHWLSEQTGTPHAIGEKVGDIAALWRDFYHLPEAFDVERDFDRLMADGDRFAIGDLEASLMLSPGHTLGSVTCVVGDAAFVHDTLMHVDVGTARADFPGGSAHDLWASIRRILALPENTRLFVGHDYGTEQRETPACEATVAQHRRDNPHVGGDATKDSFVTLRNERDKTLGLPDRMLHALQVNLRGGRLPPAESDGHSYFKIPAESLLKGMAVQQVVRCAEACRTGG